MKAWFQRSKKYVSIVLVIILFCAAISILSIPYTKELIGLIKLSSPKISNAESVQVYTAIYMALTSFVGVFIGIVGIAGTLIIISMQHDQIKIQKDQLLDGETEARFEKNRLMNILKDERRRHEELIGIEKEKLRLGMVDSEIREAHRVIEMIEDLISDLSFFRRIGWNYSKVNERSRCGADLFKNILRLLQQAGVTGIRIFFLWKITG